MPYLSEFIGRPVVDVDGKPVGRFTDLIAREVPDLPHPIVEAVVVQRGHEMAAVPSASVAVWVSPAVPLKVSVENLPSFSLEEQDIYLVRDVLDKQIIDTEGARVVRVNDLELLRVNGTLYVGNVDISGLGVLRRLGLGKVSKNIASRLNLRAQGASIPWNDVELLRSDQSMRLKVPVEKISELHPADLAEILSDLNRLEGGQFLEALDVEHLADALEEVEPDFQASLVESMPDERIADILEEMDPDEAADLLAELPEERSQDLLALMEADEAEDVSRLLGYPEDSAGGIMTTDFAAVRSNLTAAQAIQVLRETADEAETIFYIYVIDEADHLVGVFSLKNLIFAVPGARISDFMQKRVVTVNLYDDQDEVAQVIAKYNLLAVPVVDDEDRLQGIVTFDDALDRIIPTAWKKRLPRFFR
jgi:CBS domain-containing protein/sporulation protein YlmC with PRC-barrel domain